MTNLLMGKKAIIEQLKKDNVLSVHGLSSFPEIKKICDAKNILYKIQNKEFFKNFPSNHQGIIAYVKREDFLTEDINEFIKKVSNSHNKRKLILILDKLEDTRNFGAIIRTCDAFNVDGIIIKKNNQTQINDFVIKSSTGAIYNSNILKTPNLNNIVEFLKKEKFWIVSTTLDSAENVNDMSFDFDLCLIIGNEKNGVSKSLIEKSDFKVKIPMSGSVQSLNVSVATGIILNCIRNYHYKE